MKQNPPSNFLDSASNYWSSKFKFSRSSANTTPELPYPPTNQIAFIPQTCNTSPAPPYYPQNQPIFSSNLVSQPMNSFPPPNHNYYVPNNNFGPGTGRFQNLTQVGGVYPNPPMKQIAIPNNRVSNGVEFNSNYYQNYYPYNQNDHGFGAILNKANNFWRPSPTFSQNPNHMVPHPQQQQYNFYQGFYSDPLSREFSSSNKDSEHISMENNFLNRTYEEGRDPLALKATPNKKIKKKNYKRKNRSESRKNEEKNQNTGDSVSIAKKMLAIANNWQEVCKKIPPNLQVSFKERMKRYLKKRILPDLQLKNKLQKFVPMKEQNQDPFINNFTLEDRQGEFLTKENENNDSKFDEFFGQDLEKLLQKNEEKGEPAGGFDWQSFKNRELESPTLSKMIRPDALSINFNNFDKEVATLNDFEEKMFLNENNMNRAENSCNLNLEDFMANENKDNFGFKE